MTVKQLNVIEAFPYGGRWYHPGEKFPPESVAVEDALLGRYTGVYLLSDAELAKRDNPQAYQAMTELERAQAQVRELTEQLAEAQQRSGPDLTPLLSLFLEEDGSLPTFEDAVAAAEQAQKDAQASLDDEDAAELQAYREHVGELLPQGVSAGAAKVLRQHGFVGRALITRIPDAELLALSGVAQGTVDVLRAWAPFVGAPAAQDTSEAPAGGDTSGAPPAPADAPAPPLAEQG